MPAPSDPMSQSIAAAAGVSARSNVAPRLAYEDLRQWLDEARKLGEVKEVSGLSWQEDIGLVSGVAMHDDGAPCFVFDEVPGTIKGSRVLVNFFGGNRNGTRPTAAATSAPAASTSPAIRTRAGSIAAPIA
jgi:hypothetical protein